MRRPQVQATILEWNKHSLWENINRLTTSQDIKLKGQTEGRINFLLLGQGGPNHDGPFLTDTILVASLSLKNKQIALLSLPRDLVVPIPNMGLRKINSANAIGEGRSSGSGPILASQIIERALDLPIHYYARLDFSGFAKIIDELGGLPITIDKDFTDNQYPTKNNGYITITFNKGLQVLTGEKALQYVRSRHANNGEGSDFARAHRQQQVLLALKNKLLSTATFLNPTLLIRLYHIFTQSVQTNLTAGESIQLAHLLKGVKASTIFSRVLDASPYGLLHETTGLDGAYLLLPNTADYSELKSAAQNLFEQASVLTEESRIGLENGTPTPGLAEATATSLKRQGFNITYYRNAESRNLPQTILYDYSGGRKPKTKQILENLFGITAVNLENSELTNVDFRLILGTDKTTAPKLP